MEIAIRLARATDSSALLAIEEACFTDPWAKSDLEEHKCLVATASGEIAGFLIWREIFAGDHKSPAEAEILNVAVKTEYRRSGIASALLGHLFTKPAIYFLEVRKSNSAARQLYKHLGFVEVGRRSGYYSHPTETAIVMRMKRC